MLTTMSTRTAVCLNLTRAISRARAVEDICEIALDTLQDGLGVSRSSILFFDAEGVMRFEAHRGISDAYRRAVEGHTPWAPNTPDPEPIVVGDVTEDTALAPYLSALQAEGISALAFVPLVSQGRAIGTFTLYYDAPHTLDAITSGEWAHPYSREEAAFPAPWVRERKFWPWVSRVDNVFGDRNVVCTCPPVEAYAS